MLLIKEDHKELKMEKSSYFSSFIVSICIDNLLLSSLLGWDEREEEKDEEKDDKELEMKKSSYFSSFIVSIRIFSFLLCSFRGWKEEEEGA